LPRGRIDPSSPIRIAHVITDLDTAGAELMLARLVEVFAANGRVANSVIALGARGVLADRIEAAGVPVLALGMRPGKPDPRGLWKLVRQLRRVQPAIVQTWLYHADFAGLLAGALTHTPVIWNIRCAELDPRDHPPSLATLLRALALASRYPAAVICNSQAGQRAHDRLGYTPRRWAVIPNGFDTNVFRPCPGAASELRRELGLPDTSRLVGLMARFHPMKDHPTFVSAAQVVTAAKPDAHFVAAGRGVDTSPSLQALLDDGALRGRVHLLPERRDAPRFLAALDVAVSSSYGEAFPNVVGEAMACGTPCVVTDVGDSARIVGEAGVVVPPRDPGALAAGIVRLLEMAPPEHAALKTAARDRIATEFSLARAAAQYEALYADVARRPLQSPDDTACAE
jgi:glycosyltransferase involved in cell wall biosynthesis